MYKLIPYVIVPLALWGYLWFKTKKDATPRMKNIINTLGSTLLVFGLTTYVLDWIPLGITLKMILIMIAGAAWAVWFNFFRKKKTLANSK